MPNIRSKYFDIAKLQHISLVAMVTIFLLQKGKPVIPIPPKKVYGSFENLTM